MNDNVRWSFILLSETSFNAALNLWTMVVYGWPWTSFYEIYTQKNNNNWIVAVTSNSDAYDDVMQIIFSFKRIFLT